MVRTIELASATHRGLVRAGNQDVALLGGWAGTGAETSFPAMTIALDRVLTMAVIDGMGGHRGGDLAAWITAYAIGGGLAEVGDAQSADTLAQHAHELVSDAGAGVGLPDMGAAFAALILDPGGFGVCNVGDCRAYRWSDHSLGQLTIDDTGLSRRDPNRTVLTQSIGGGEPRSFDSHWFGAPWAEARGQRFLIASDGLAVVPHVRLTDLLEVATPAECVAALIAETLAVGAPDNVTVIVVDVSADRSGV